MNTVIPAFLSNWLLRTTAEASILILAVFALRLIFGKRLSPGWRIGLWLLVGLKLLLPACIPAGFGLGHWLAREAESVSIPAEFVATSAVPLISAPVEAALIAAPPGAESLSLPVLGFSVWLTGVLIVLGGALVRQRRFERALRSRPVAADPHLLSLTARLSRLAGVRRLTLVVLMPAGATPAVVGFRRPRLLLPEDWSTRFDEPALRHILLHELLHVRKNDLVWNWAALAVQALHWFNPLVWLVVARFQSDRELRCDAGALALLAPHERYAYGHTLLRLQQTFFAPAAIAGLAPWVRNHPSLRQRIHMIAEPTRNHPWLHALFAATFSIITCYAFATVRAADEEKAVPAKDRSREGARTQTPGEGPAEKPAPREREGDAKIKEGARDGDRPKTGERDGMRKKSAEGDGAPRTGPRDGEKKKNGAKDDDKPKTGERDGGPVRIKTPEPNPGDAEAFAIHITKGGETVVIAGEEVPANRLRGYLHNLFSDHAAPKTAIVTADLDVTYKAAIEVVDATRDNGIKNVKLKTAGKD